MDSTTVDRMFRRIQMLFGRARVRFVNDAGVIQKMQVSMTAAETPDNRLRMAEFGFTSNPPIGSDAIALHMAGDRGGGVVVATNHQASRPTGLATGETMLYSQDGKFVYLTASGGISVFANGQPVNVTGATSVTINASEKIRFETPLLQCTGDIVDNCDSTGRSMQADRAIYDGHNHPVPNVQSGSSTVESGSPNQQE